MLSTSRVCLARSYCPHRPEPSVALHPFSVDRRTQKPALGALLILALSRRRACGALDPEFSKPRYAEPEKLPLQLIIQEDPHVIVPHGLQEIRTSPKLSQEKQIVLELQGPWVWGATCGAHVGAQAKV